MWKLTADPILSAPNEPEDVTVEFERGIPVKISSPSTGAKTNPTELFLAANALARKHGVGRIDVSTVTFRRMRSVHVECSISMCAHIFGWLRDSYHNHDADIVPRIDCREPLHWVEVARLLRDPRPHHPAFSPHRSRRADSRPRSPRSSRPICDGWLVPCLVQRTVLLTRARILGCQHQRVPEERQRPGPSPTLQGQLHHLGPQQPD